MNQKELTKTFMMISIKKNPLVPMDTGCIYLTIIRHICVHAHSAGGTFLDYICNLRGGFWAKLRLLFVHRRPSHNWYDMSR